MRRKLLTLACLLCLLPFHALTGDRSHTPNVSHITQRLTANSMAFAEELYERMHMAGRVNFMAFREAVVGYCRIKDKRKPILTLIDFTKPSVEKRMYVFDMEHEQLLFETVVAHGKNSGENYATSFSNVSGSYKSSLGFYLTGGTYQGKNGYSLVLNGLEKGINDKARERAIVVHGADYANPKQAVARGRLGRSFGCPAVPREVTKPIIDTLKEGSVLFIYANHPEYFSASSVLNTEETVHRA